MKKKILIVIGVLLFVSICLTYLIKSFEYQINNEKTKFEVNIGKSVIIENDTLSIMDYSMLESNYTLSNGKKVSFELINKLTIIK